MATKPKPQPFDKALAARLLREAIAKSGIDPKTATPKKRGALAKMIAQKAEVALRKEARKLLKSQSAKGRLAPTDVASWSKASHRLMLASHAAATRALQGKKDPSKDDMAALAKLSKAQLAYFKKFALQVSKGEVSNAKIVARSGLYGAATWGVANNANRVSEESSGANQERRVMGLTEHCRTCIDAASQGWQPIGTLPEIGASECKARCACLFLYRKVKNPDAAGQDSDVD